MDLPTSNNLSSFSQYFSNLSTLSTISLILGSISPYRSSNSLFISSNWKISFGSGVKEGSEGRVKESIVQTMRAASL